MNIDSENIEVASLVLGTLIISAGWTITGVSAFDGNVPAVILGYMLFIAGYKLSWYGTHSVNNLRQLKQFLNTLKPTLTKHIRRDWDNYILISIGLIFVGYGTTIFAEIITGELIVFKTVLAGILCFGGYMVSHEGVNEVLV